MLKRTSLSTRREPCAIPCAVLRTILARRVPNQKSEILFRVNCEVRADPAETCPDQKMIVGVAGDVGVELGASGDGVIAQSESRDGGREPHEHGFGFSGTDDEIRPGSE